MTGLSIFAGPVWQNLVFALIHTLWQGALLALLVHFALGRIAAGRHNARYAFAMGGQLGVLLAGLVTWAVLNTADGVGQPLSGSGPPVSAKTQQNAPAVHPILPVSNATSAPAEAAPAATAAYQSWVPWAAAAWLAGVAIMLLRTILSVVAAQRLGRGAPMVDERILAAVEQLRGQLQIGRRIKVVANEFCHGPAVLGVFWPTLVLPMSLLTGLSPDSVRAILAHELAHVRRHDYLLNLVQMVVESLVFFNPAVWWIGRQIRAEREACCDAVAVAITGEPIGYTRTLADLLERMPSGAAPAMAWAGSGGEKPVLDRVRRVLLPGYQPEVPISWSGLGGLVILGPLVLAGLWQGTTAAVALAAEILSPGERMERVAAIEEAYGERPQDASQPEGTFTISGQVRMADGSPLPPKSFVGGSLMRRGYSGSLSLELDEAGRFTKELDVGTVYLHVHSPGYALAIAGPFQAKPGEQITDVDLVVGRGFSARIRFVDDTGAPIPAVKLEAMMYRLPFEEGWSGYPHPQGEEQLQANEQGVATLERCSEWPLHIDARAGGYQFEQREWKLEPDGTVTWQLKAARPTTGVVVSEMDGQPIAGAELFLAQRKGHADVNQDPRNWSRKPLLAVSDDEGRFRLDTLRDDCRYVVYAEAEGYGVKLVGDVTAGRDGLNVALGPPLRIRGRLIGKLDELPRDYQAKKPYINYRNPIKLLDNFGYDTILRTPVDIRDGVGHFEITDLFAGYVELNPPGRAIRLNVEQSIDDLAIDLTEPPKEEVALDNRPKRPVVFAFDIPDGGFAPRGKLRIGYSMDGVGLSGFQDMTVEPEGPEVRAEMLLGSRVFYDGSKLLGYWVKNRSGIDVPPGEEPLRVEIPMLPAGAIYGRVVESDGSPVQGGRVHLVTVDKPPELEFSPMDSVAIERNDGRFMLSPIPLAGRYRVLAKAAKSEARALSAIFELGPEQPLREVELRLVEGVTLRGQVLGPDGRPVAGAALAFGYTSPHSSSYGEADVKTDAEGRFTFQRLDPDLPGEYSLTLRHTETLRGRYIEIDNPAEPLVIHAKTGEQLSGVLLDAGTERPLADTKITAWLADYRDVEYGVPITTTTDLAGRFEFKNLEPTAYHLKIQDGDVLGIDPPSESLPGNDQAAVRAGITGSVKVLAKIRAPGGA